MAIPFLNSITLNNNELQNAKLHVTNSAPAAELGQIYFNTNSSENRVRVHNGTEFKAVAWYDDIPTSVVESLTLNNSMFITLANSGTATDPSITASLSATGTPSASTFLRGDNTWATPADNNTTYDLSAANGSNYANIVLTDSNSGTDQVTIHGVTNETTVDASGNIIYVGLPDDVTITGELTVSGTGQSSFGGQVTIPATPIASTDAASKAYVDASVTGGLIYQGGYNASTNTPDLTTSPNSIKKGWTYTVTADGTFFGIQLRSGDVLIAEIDNPLAGVDWTIVEKNTDYANVGIIGIGNVTAGTGISVSYNTTGTATVSLAASAATSGSIAVPNSATYTYPNGITASSTNNVLIQLVDSNGETVYADVQRLSPTTFSVNYGVTTPTGVIALIQLVG